MCSHPQLALTYRGAGLPDIQGKIVACVDAWDQTVYTGTNSFGCFLLSHTNYKPNVSAGYIWGGNNHSILEFDASWSSKIYGRSTTVQPSAVTMNYFIRAR